MRDPFCNIPTTQTLGWPKNISHATAPHAAMVMRFAQRAAEVLALSATGEELSADLVVTEGHKHNTNDTLREWAQLAAWPVVGRTLAAGVRVGQVIQKTSDEDLGLYLFRMPLDGSGVRIRDVFYPRIRATIPTPGDPADSVMVVSGDLVRIAGGGVITVVQALPALNLTARTNRWFTFGAVEIPAATTDARLGLRLRARVAVGGQSGTVFEVAVGLRGGL